MPDPNEVAVEVPAGAEPDPENFDAWNEWRENGGGKRSGEEEITPAGRVKTPPSVPLEEIPESQTVPDSDPENEAGQETEVEVEEEVQVPAKKHTGLERRIRELTGEIKALKSQVHGQIQPDVETEAEAEVVSAPEPAAEAEAIAPRLSDYEDTETESAWDQYATATAAFNKAEIAKAVLAARTEERQAAQLDADKKAADAAWSKAAQRFPDYDTVVMNDAIQVSPAMLSVCKADMDAELGTEIAYYLGQHPEEAKRIAALTMANNPAEFQRARVRAGIELARISAKIVAPGAAAPTPATKIPAPSPNPTPKKITTAPPPPTQLRGTAAPAKLNVNADADAGDFEKWERQRNAELAASGKR